MLAHKKIFYSAKTFAIAALAISLAACAPATETATTTTETTNPATSVATSPAPEAAAPANVTIPGVSNASEVTFKPPANYSLGFFDAVNNSTAQRVEVQKDTPIVVSGWAFLADKNEPPDSVIITYGDNNTLLAVAPANLARPDVVKALNKSDYSNTGWSATIDATNLPTGAVVLKAWAYNADTKEATQISNTHEVVISG